MRSELPVYLRNQLSLFEVINLTLHAVIGKTIVEVLVLSHWTPADKFNGRNRSKVAQKFDGALQNSVCRLSERQQSHRAYREEVIFVEFAVEAAKLQLIKIEWVLVLSLSQNSFLSDPRC